MKEIIDLQTRAVAHAPQFAEDDSVDISRDEIGGETGLLSAELRGEVEALQQTLNAAIPEDFDYFVFIGGEEGPFFGLDSGRMPVSPEDDWDPARSIIDQLRTFDWDAAREEGKKGQAMMEVMALWQRMTRTLPSAKSLQRNHREEVKDFIREKRRDAGKIHVLYLDEAGELMEVDFENGDAFRDVLPGMIGEGNDLFAVVANGKPLPVERIDALTAQGQSTLKEQMKKRSEEATREEAAEQPATEVIDIEVEQQSS